jgi:mRNA interferase HigB
MSAKRVSQSLQIENFALILQWMNIIARGTIQYYTDKYPVAKTALLTWYHEFLKMDFGSFNALKSVYGNASLVGNERVVFNIRGNEFRLVVSVNFRMRAAYIIWFGTHTQYDRINVATVKFNISILNYKLK